MWLETIQKPENNKEKCPTCGGGIHRRTYSEMYAGTLIQNGERVEIRRKPNEEYRSAIVLDELTQYFDGGLYRIWPSEKYFTRGGKKLHREVWRVAFGQIPEKSHIHHIDGNPANNQLENLECLPASIHLSERKHKHSGFNDLARERASDWHKSEEGRLWHSRHAIRAQGWTKWKRESKICPVCKKEFDALVRKSGCTQIYCHANCKAKAARDRLRK